MYTPVSTQQVLPPYTHTRCTHTHTHIHYAWIVVAQHALLTVLYKSGSRGRNIHWQKPAAVSQRREKICRCYDSMYGKAKKAHRIAPTIWHLSCLPIVLARAWGGGIHQLVEGVMKYPPPPYTNSGANKSWPNETRVSNSCMSLIRLAYVLLQKRRFIDRCIIAYYALLRALQ